MARVTVTLKTDEREALVKLAEREFRDPRAQAALLIRDGLQRAELLPMETPTPTNMQPAQPSGVSDVHTR